MYFFHFHHYSLLPSEKSLQCILSFDSFVNAKFQIGFTTSFEVTLWVNTFLLEVLMWFLYFSIQEFNTFCLSPSLSLSMNFDAFYKSFSVDFALKSIGQFRFYQMSADFNFDILKGLWLNTFLYYYFSGMECIPALTLPERFLRLF